MGCSCQKALVIHPQPAKKHQHLEGYSIKMKEVPISDQAIAQGAEGHIEIVPPTLQQSPEKSSLHVPLEENQSPSSLLPIEEFSPKEFAGLEASSVQKNMESSPSTQKKASFAIIPSPVQRAKDILKQEVSIRDQNLKILKHIPVESNSKSQFQPAVLSPSKQKGFHFGLTPENRIVSNHTLSSPHIKFKSKLEYAPVNSAAFVLKPKFIENGGGQFDQDDPPSFSCEGSIEEAVRYSDCSSPEELINEIDSKKIYGKKISLQHVVENEPSKKRELIALKQKEEFHPLKPRTELREYSSPQHKPKVSSIRGDLKPVIESGQTLEVPNSKGNPDLNSSINRAPNTNENSICFDGKKEFTGFYNKMKSKFATGKGKKSNLLQEVQKDSTNKSVYLGVEDPAEVNNAPKSMRDLLAERSVGGNHRKPRPHNENQKKNFTQIEQTEDIANRTGFMKKDSIENFHYSVSLHVNKNSHQLNISEQDNQNHFGKATSIDGNLTEKKFLLVPDSKPKQLVKDYEIKQTTGPESENENSSDDLTVKFGQKPKPAGGTIEEGQSIDYSSISKEPNHNFTAGRLLHADDPHKESSIQRGSVNNTLTFRADKESGIHKDNSDKRVQDNKTVFTFARSTLNDKSAELRNHQDTCKSPSLNQDVSNAVNQDQSVLKTFLLSHRHKLSPEASFTGSPTQSLRKPQHNRFQSVSHISFVNPIDKTRLQKMTTDGSMAPIANENEFVRKSNTKEHPSKQQ
jgi:hypothetical protein